MQHARLALSALMLALTASLAMGSVDPALLALAPPDATALTGLAVDQSQASPFGQYLLSLVQPGNEFNQFVAMTGFDPRRDLRDIMAASAASKGGLVLARGTFQIAKLKAAAVLAGATTSTYKGFEIVSQNGKNSGYFVFLDNSTAALGDIDSVKAVIDRRIAGTVFSGALAQKAREVGAQGQGWYVTSASPASMIGALPGQGDAVGTALQSLVSSYGSLQMTATTVTLSADAVMKSDKDAQALADVIRFGAGMIQLNRDKNPAAAKIATLADAATFTASGTVMHLSLSLPEKQAEQLVTPAAHGNAKKSVAAR